MNLLLGVKVGDAVKRTVDGLVFMELRVTRVTASIIQCGAWTFDRTTGAEIDDQLQWGPKYGFTGSYIQC